jgi:hypothetical protein
MRSDIVKKGVAKALFRALGAAARGAVFAE